VLDAILAQLVEEQRAPEEIVGSGFDDAIVKAGGSSGAHQRARAPGLIVTHKAFGPGRRIPIAQRYGP
jgi:NAD+ synthase (glutamine-hydrolysing)